MKNTDKTIIAYGEMLWDVLPNGRQPGGGPMNVAVHLNNFGIPTFLISKIGNDNLGEELLAFLKQKNVPVKFVQKGETHLTGVVKANITDAKEVIYKIVQPVAWDYIQYRSEMEELVSRADIFVYGSLITRQEPSRNTLYTLLEKASYKVFDVNLRPPHYNQERVNHLLEAADMVKMNHHELHEITGWHTDVEDAQKQMRFLANHFALQSVCVSLGEKGAWLLEAGQFYHQPAFKVAVKDTIGSGDAFLAALLNKKIEGENPQECLKYACAVGAYVATQEGATPAINAEIIEDFIQTSAQ